MPANFEAHVKTFQENIIKLEELYRNNKLSPSDRTKVEKILEGFTGTDTKEKEETLSIISKFLKHDTPDDNIKDSLYTFVIIELITIISDTLKEVNKKTSIKNFDKIQAIIEGTPSSSIIMRGGKNKNKSKKNKQSNKNKTRRRRNSNSKKVKFVKIKKV